RRHFASSPTWKLARQRGTWIAKRRSSSPWVRLPGTRNSGTDHASRESPEKRLGRVFSVRLNHFSDAPELQRIERAANTAPLAPLSPLWWQAIWRGIFTGLRASRVSG